MFVFSSVRRILKREGARNFRKFERNIDQNLKFSYSNFVPFFAQNQMKSKKKRSSLKFRPIFHPKSGDFEPKAQLAKGGGHASILLTFLCNFAILATQRGGHGSMPPLNTPLFVFLCLEKKK